ncbi:GAF domain-containing protein [Limoniibacter endophyticus]|uniref:GAF domain-containing protein n=1 Tax=Limoniibacter endophyticus TaxID=1565040 RepID=A0A8J3GGY4_9HYPH|nr:GAF domain-containing protein [Limoniibacter endophyticus]GHC68551.1 hypothetical protein GCM10010136_13370 [Limoniibacter endophyticus]
MRHQAKLNDPQGRLAAVNRIAVWGKTRNPEFGPLSDLIASVFHAPIAIVSLIDDKRQWYVSSIGMEQSELPSELTFCQYTIRQQQVLAIEDTTRDERVRNHPLVIGHPHIRSYLGVPLTTADGYNVGTVCICDFAPRRFSARDFSILSDIAKVAMGYFDLRQIAMRSLDRRVVAASFSGAG